MDTDHGGGGSRVSGGLERLFVKVPVKNKVGVLRGRSVGGPPLWHEFIGSKSSKRASRWEEGPGVEDGFDWSSVSPTHAHSGGEKGGKRGIVVFDLDNTLFHAVKTGAMRKHSDGSVSHVYRTHPRPHLNFFLDTISKYYELMVFTMASREYALDRLEELGLLGRYFNIANVYSNENTILDKDGVPWKSLKVALCPDCIDRAIAVDDKPEVWATKLGHAWCAHELSYHTADFRVFTLRVKRKRVVGGLPDPGSETDMAAFGKGGGSGGDSSSGGNKVVLDTASALGPRVVLGIHAYRYSAESSSADNCLLHLAAFLVENRSALIE